MGADFYYELEKYLDPSSQRFDLFGNYESVTLEDVGPILVAVFKQSDGNENRAAFKTEGAHWKIKNSSTLISVNEKLRQRSPELFDALPWIQQAGPNYEWIAMEYIEGHTLDNFLASSGSDPEQIDSIFETLGRIVANIHSIGAEEVGLPSTNKRNREYLSVFEDNWRDHTVNFLLPRGFKTSDQVLRVIDPKVWERTLNRVLMIDFQPKNVLVGKNSKISLIDPDFSVGNPAMATGFFLNGMNQSVFSHRNWASPKMIARYQHAFIRSYMEQMEPWLVDDLSFFYPWTILESSRMHALRSRFPRKMLEYLYTFFLRRYCQKLDSPKPGGSGSLGISTFSI